MWFVLDALATIRVSDQMIRTPFEDRNGLSDVSKNIVWVSKLKLNDTHNLAKLTNKFYYKDVSWWFYVPLTKTVNT